ncbi:MAG: FAD-binding protein [Rhodobiaceae bacterium]|nr:FAD-binding protein [Rhodobiaceae bacterium]MCC0056055.1 FAD-binding protein [Rhodobiaceae bacterium]
MSENDSNPWDVIIVGAGFAGLTAGIAAAEAGARTLIVESEAVPGGGASISSGILWAPQSTADLTGYVTDGDPALQSAYCDNFFPALEWFMSHGLPLSQPAPLGDLGIGIVMEGGTAGKKHEFMALMAEAARRKGAEIRFNAPLQSAVRSEDGYLVNLGGGKMPVRTRAIVFAGGGFQANSELVDRYIGANAARAFYQRGMPANTGAGLQTALSLGAGESRNMNHVYGHSMPDAPLPPERLQPLTAYIALHSIAVNRAGKRFVNETEGKLEEVILEEAWKQDGGVFWLIFDDRTYRQFGIDTGISPALPKIDRLVEWRAVGAPVFEARSLEELAQQLHETEGVSYDALETINTFNAACHAGTAENLDPPRSINPDPVEHGPFYALRARGGLSATCGGIRVDDAMRVLDSAGNALPGLYAAGVDAGGVFGRYYGGWLGWALVSGWLAGQGTAAR